MPSLSTGMNPKVEILVNCILLVHLKLYDEDSSCFEPSNVSAEGATQRQTRLAPA